MRLFKGQIEVRETDTIEIHSTWLHVFDKNGNEKYYEDSYGTIIDMRLKEITIEQQKKKDELLDLYRLLIELKEIVAFEVKLLDREKVIQDIQDISIRIYLLETELKG